MAHMKTFYFSLYYVCGHMEWLKNVTFILTVFLFCVMVLKSNFSCSMSNRESDKILHRNICIYY